MHPNMCVKLLLDHLAPHERKRGSAHRDLVACNTDTSSLFSRILDSLRSRCCAALIRGWRESPCQVPLGVAEVRGFGHRALALVVHIGVRSDKEFSHVRDKTLMTLSIDVFSRRHGRLLSESSKEFSGHLHEHVPGMLKRHVAIPRQCLQSTFGMLESFLHHGAHCFDSGPVCTAPACRRLKFLAGN